jgi:hypothetical protein
MVTFGARIRCVTRRITRIVKPRRSCLPGFQSKAEPLGLFGVQRPVRDARLSRRVTAAPVELAHAFESSEGFKLREVVRDDPGVDVAAVVGNLPQFNAHIFSVGRLTRLVNETRNSSEKQLRIDHHSRRSVLAYTDGRAGPLKQADKEPTAPDAGQHPAVRVKTAGQDDKET